jgi:putative copper resistance protein D
MAAIADFLSDIIDGCGLVAFGLAVGGMAWSLVILRASNPGTPFAGAPTARAISLIRLGAIGLGAAEIIELAANAYVLAATMGRSPFPELYHVAYFQAALARALLAFAMAGAAGSLARVPHDGRRWALLSAIGLAVVVAGAWHSHGASRIEYRDTLMALTAIHSFAGALWVGGVLHLLALRLLIWRESALRPLWPMAIARFSLLGIGAVGLALLTATPLALYYVQSVASLLGTGYGSIIMAKILLLGSALAFAGLNFRAGKRWSRSGETGEVTRRVPHYIEAETFILVSLLMAAAALAHQPPALDIASERASLAEVVQVFAPKLPKVTSPAHAEMPTDPNNPLGLSARDQSLEDEWSEYNHNVSGLTLVSISLLALLSRRKGFEWARHWPLGFVALAIFLFIRSDPENWPLGRVPFWQSFASAEVFQHRIAILLAAVLGLVEWRARLAKGPEPWYGYVFPVLAAIGGLLLLTHSHSAFEVKPQYLIQLSHTVMGMLAVFLACGRWLELRLEPPASRWAGFVALCSMLLIGIVLTFYKENIIV